jgi:hypothetical protein
VQRYGGDMALAQNEQLFALSSRLAIHALTATQGDIPRRSRQAIDFMLAVPAAAMTDNVFARDFFGQYADGWRHILAPAALEMSEKVALKASPWSSIAGRIDRLRATSGGAPKGLSQYWLHGLEAAVARFQLLAGDGKLVAPDTGKAVVGPQEATGAIYMMLASQMHMLNNRLGFTPLEEFAWATALAAAPD